MNGKFVIEKTGTQFKTRILEQNDYAEVSVNYTTTNNLFRLTSFTIIDKNGFQYVFQHSDKLGRIENGISGFNGYFAEKRTFYLSKVIDKYNKNLLTYHYSGNDIANPQNNIYYNVNLTSIDVNGKGEISFNTIGFKRILTYRNLKSELIHKIEFIFNSHPLLFDKLLVKDVRIYNNTETNFKSYKISYKNYDTYSGEPIKDYIGFRYTACNNTWDWTASKINYDQGAVEKITTPEGGVTFYEYEPNTIGTNTPKDMEGYNPEGPIYKSFLKDTRSKPENFTFELIPLVYNPLYGGYQINLNNYIHPDDDKVIYVDYQVTPVEIYPPSSLLPNGRYYTPTLKAEHYTTFPSGNYISTVAPKECDPGIPVYLQYPQTKIMLKIESQYQSYYNYVRAYYKKPKADGELVYYDYGIGPRIKRIKSFSNDVSTINSTDYVVNEKVFKYELFDQPRTSSGHFLPNINEFSESTDYALYKNVTVEIPDMGKVLYEFTDAGEHITYTKDNAYLFKYIKNVQKYNEQNQITERIDFERNFNGNILMFEKALVKSFEKAGAQVLETMTESTFDTVTRNLTHRKITDAEAQTFEEQYIYQKLGNAYYNIKVEKFKNSTALNRTEFEYKKIGKTQAYNLWQTKAAKSTFPLEIVEEITRYDNNGNVLEYKTKEGLVVSQIWGYNDSKLVAELKNVSHADISDATITNIRTLSNFAATSYNETSLETILNNLRNTHNTGYVTTYIYKPLVGLTSITDPNGRKETYQYDSFNRLYRVINNEGLVIKEYTYNTKN